MKTLITFAAIAFASTASADVQFVGSLDAAERSVAGPRAVWVCEGSLEAAENCQAFVGSLDNAERIAAPQVTVTAPSTYVEDARYVGSLDAAERSAFQYVGSLEAAEASVNRIR